MVKSVIQCPDVNKTEKLVSSSSPKRPNLGGIHHLLSRGNKVHHPSWELDVIHHARIIVVVAKQTSVYAHYAIIAQAKCCIVMHYKPICAYT